MVRKASECKRHGRAILLCLALIGWALPAEAQQIGNWMGYFVNGGEVYYTDHPMNVAQDGAVTLVTTVDSTFLNQFSASGVACNICVNECRIPEGGDRLLRTASEPGRKTHRCCVDVPGESLLILAYRGFHGRGI
jgi:hypothetical protein